MLSTTIAVLLNNLYAKKLNPEDQNHRGIGRFLIAWNYYILIQLKWPYYTEWNNTLNYVGKTNFSSKLEYAGRYGSLSKLGG